MGLTEEGDGYGEMAVCDHRLDRRKSPFSVPKLYPQYTRIRAALDVVVNPLESVTGSLSRQRSLVTKIDKATGSGVRLRIRHQPARAARSRVSRCRISADVQKVWRESGGPLRRKAVGYYAVPLPALNSLDKPFDSGTHLVHETPSEDQSARVPEKLPLIDANQYRLVCVRDAPSNHALSLPQSSRKGCQIPRVAGSMTTTSANMPYFSTLQCRGSHKGSRIRASH